MTGDRASVSSTEHLDSTPARQSGIVAAGTGEDLGREAMPVAERSTHDTGHQPDIDVDVMASGAASPSDGIEPAPISVPEESVIEVSDAELEPADSALVGRPSMTPAPGRATLPPGSGAASRSRPPVPPSARPKSGPARASGSPARRAQAGAVEGDGRASTPPSSRNDPWALANKTLELNRARARIAELEEFIAFRDARILTLEDRLEKAQARIDELEQRLDPVAFAEARRQSSSLAPGVAGLFDPRSKKLMQQGSARSGSSGGEDVQSGTDTLGSAARLDAAEREDDDEPSETEDDASSASEPLDADEGAGAPRPTGTEEDLRVIAGIGARFEAALRKQGITRLSQIASWSDADVRQVAKALKIPKSRIVKGRWVESAREAIGCRAASE